MPAVGPFEPSDENGVAAAPVLDSGQLLRDSHLTERGFVSWTDHPEAGRRAMGNVAWKLDGARPTEYGPTPLLGEHNDYVLQELLGLSVQEAQQLVIDRVVA